MCQYGHEPEWDNSGAVSHLMPVLEMTNKEEYAWLFNNDIPYEVVAIDHGRKVKHIRFTDIEDAMAFKLRWL